MPPTAAHRFLSEVSPIQVDATQPRCETPPSNKGGRQVATKASRQFLMAHVQQCYSQLHRLETNHFFQKRQLEYVVSPQHFAIIEEHKEQVKAKMSSSCKERQKRKF